MWDVRACRGCLTVKCKLEKIGEASKRLYTVLTGLQITDGDGYPNYFCVECRIQLRKCLAFRRKSRRAHFVLKEIMTIRKQVTYSDIITVNRRKTNLESQLKYWDPQKTSSYLIMNADEQDSLTELKPTNLTYGSNYTHIVDIKPEIIKTEVETPVEDIEDTNEDNSTTEQIDKEPKEEEPVPADIDLNDIFKDLNDDNNSSENEETQEPKSKVETKDEKEKKHMLDKRLSLISTVTAVAACKIRVLSLEEQIKNLEVRQKQEPFYHAQFKCSMCFTTYKRMEQLVEHVKFHNERRFGHECQVCKNKLETVEELKLHVARTHLYEYTCKCRAVFYAMYDIVTHHKQCAPRLARRRNILAWSRMFQKAKLTEEMRWEMAAFRAADHDRKEVHKPKTPTDIQCDLCGIWVSCLLALQTHTRLTHQFSYTCRECKEVFSQRSQASKHAHTHLKNKVWPCKICGTHYKSVIGLASHRTRKHSIQIPCNLCGRSCPTIWSLYRHQLTEHKYLSLNDPLVGDPQHQCTTCQVQFVDRAALFLHLVLAEHAGAEDVPFSCIPCKKVYECKEKLETHLITCKQPVKYPRQCCYCEEMLLDKGHYKRHYTKDHPTLQYRYASMNTICETCGKSIFKPNLEAHLKSHKGSAYECRCCGASSLDPTVHVNHVLSQHAARPFCCTLCTRRFQHRSDCRDHILKIHAPAKLYKCEFCGLEFSYFRRLKDHSIKLHNLVLPYLRIPKATKLKIFVYAHMVIEINVLEKEAVEKSEVELLDYLGQKSKRVNYAKYFKFHTRPDEYFIKKRIRKQKPKITQQSKTDIESDAVNGQDGDVTDEDFQGNGEPVARVDVELLGNEVEIAVTEIQPHKKDEVVEEMVEESMEPLVFDQDPVEQVLSEEPVEQVLFDEEPVEQVVFGQELVEQVFDQEAEEQVFHQEAEDQVFDQEAEEQVFDQEAEEQVFHQEAEEQVFHQEAGEQVFHQEAEEQVVFDQETVEQVVSNEEFVHKVVFDQNLEHQVGLEQGQVEQPMEVEDAPLEVFEMNGQQYVMINGEMYKIAGENDD